MKKAETKKTVTVGKQLLRKGKTLRGKAGATARQLKETATGTASGASRRLKKGVTKAKSPASRQARKVGAAIGGFVGQAIGRAEQMVNRVVKK